MAAVAPAFRLAFQNFCKEAWYSATPSVESGMAAPPHILTSRCRAPSDALNSNDTYRVYDPASG